MSRQTTLLFYTSTSSEVVVQVKIHFSSEWMSCLLIVSFECKVTISSICTIERILILLQCKLHVSEKPIFVHHQAPIKTVCAEGE